MKKMFRTFLIMFLIVESQTSIAKETQALSIPVPHSIAVEDITSDKKIQRRLSEILAAVGNYEQVQIKVHSGVVILSGLVDETSQVEWVQNLAARMDGVVAVQNQLELPKKNLFDLAPARDEMDQLNLTVVRHLPIAILSLIVLILSYLIFIFASSGIQKILANRISSILLLNALSKLISIPLFILGLYLALRISGLTGLALTVLGGTGILGLALGLGLKNIFEDYSASIFLSIKKPFRSSDWVKIGEFEGIVQRVTSRSTLIMDFSGNHILIPNSLVYKSTITNKSANPKMRGDFVFGIDYGDSIEEAQSEILALLAQSDVVLKDPEPWVLVDELGGSSVNLRVYYWVNVREVSIFKVSSYLLLEVKKLLLERGFRFPDPAREIIFMNQLAMGSETLPRVVQSNKRVNTKSPKIAEVRSEVVELNQQARESDLPDQGKDLL